MANKKSNIKNMARYAILMALTTVMTMFIQIPSPATKGYINLGDMLVFTSAILMGKKGGFIIGGVGSALADLVLGYTHYIPITFIVKGIEGFLVGFLLEMDFFKRRPLIATLIGGVWMAFGYFLFQIFLYGFEASLLSIPGNLVQGLVGAVSSIALISGLSKISYFKENFNL